MAGAPARFSTERGTLHDLSRARPGISQGCDGTRRVVDVFKVKLSGVLACVIGQGVQHGLGNESQCALRANHQVGQNVERMIEIKQGVQRIAVGVLGLVADAHALGQRAIRQQAAAQVEQAVVNFGRSVSKASRGVRVGRVQHQSVGQNNGQRVNGVIGILDHPATHAAGIVGKDAAQHGRVKRCRIGADAASVWLEDIVDETSHRAGLGAHTCAASLHLYLPPVARQDNQDAVADGLSRKAGTRGAEGKRDTVTL
jgi:hypothetical protein